ncbi:MAG: peptidase U32 family protein [bacterium]
MDRIELLMPAGNIEKMQYAISYGADAIYLGIVDYSLRTVKSGNLITRQNIAEAVKIAHDKNVKAYVTANIFAHNDDIEQLPQFLEELADVKPDGIIFGDSGIYPLIKKYCPNIPMHISTQANILNYEAVSFWRDLGAERVILARELSLQDIEKIAQKVSDIELEVLIHGSLCVAYSGRCLISDYMTENKRKSNQGNCTQSCRWKYNIVEERRPGQYFEIGEDEGKGTYLLNPKDLALVEYIPQLINAGVHSLKVEGRTKSMYYASMVAKSYREAIDAYYENKAIDTNKLLDDLSQVGNRGFTTGFLMEKPDHSHYAYNTNASQLLSTFVGTVTEKLSDNTYKITAKNQFKVGEIIDWITPDSEYSATIKTIKKMLSDGSIVDSNVADTNDIAILEYEGNPIENWQWTILRRKEKVNVKA